MKIKKIDQLKRDMPEDKWLIKDLLLSGGLTALVASPKTTKSFFALEVAVSLCSKSATLGQHAVSGNGRVLLYSAEDTEPILRERLDGFLKSRNLTSLDGLGILTHESNLKIDNEECFTELRQQILDFKPSLLILDCFYSLHNSSENDSGSVVAILERLRTLRNETGCGILLVHHTAKDSDSKRLGARIRGSSVFHGFFETILGLRRNEIGEIFLDVEHRAAQSLDGIPIHLTVAETGIQYRVESQLASSTTTSDSLNLQILNCVQSRHTPIPLDKISKTTGQSIEVVRNAIFHLIKRGQIKFTSKGYLRGEEIQ